MADFVSTLALIIFQKGCVYSMSEEVIYQSKCFHVTCHEQNQK